MNMVKASAPIKLYEEKSNIAETGKEALMKTEEVKFIHASL